MKSVKLTQSQRVIVAFIYLFLLIGILIFSGGDVTNLLYYTDFDSSIWFYSGALMIILGSYIVEPFFSKPADAVVNSIIVIIALIGVKNKDSYFWYEFNLYFALAIFLVSIVTILIKDVKNNFVKKIGNVSYKIVETFGNAKVIFSIVYLTAAYTYYAKPDTLVVYILIFYFWVCITFFDIIAIFIKKFARLFSLLRKNISNELGQAIGCENPLLYKIEIDYQKHGKSEVKFGDLVALETLDNIGSIGMIVDIKTLLNKKWLTIYLLQDQNDEVLNINLSNKKITSVSNNIYLKENLVYLISEDDAKNLQNYSEIKNNLLYKNREQFIGYVTVGSNINTINFSIVRESNIFNQHVNEGEILKTTIYGEETLYQVINGSLQEEHLENFDRHGFIVGIARKLGKYDNEKKELNVRKWMPLIYSPIFYGYGTQIEEERLQEIAENSIGFLPNTDYEIPIKDIDALVTHNTAILGILGIGKSCLAYELLKKISEADIKIICIDITNEYKKELSNYIKNDSFMQFDEENAFNVINTKYEYIHKIYPDSQKEKQDPEKSGNINEYKIELHKDLCNFFFNKDSIPEDRVFNYSKRIRIYNVDYHKVSKGEKIGYNVLTTELTQAEKTRVISEEIFKILMKLPLQEEKKAKVLLVFEEAHSLIPEWNSVANEGDKSATNGTAKVILQGRKYGLGSLVITQRTANVSKSILNQCNTIFALRVFDDTGKGFLENYIGSDYADTLATLEERYAIAIGKGLRLKQPVIIQLNDRNRIIKKRNKNNVELSTELEENKAEN